MVATRDIVEFKSLLHRIYLHPRNKSQITRSPGGLHLPRHRPPAPGGRNGYLQRNHRPLDTVSLLCYWRHPSRSNLKWSCWRISVITVLSLLTLTWLYVSLIAFNDREDINWKAFFILNQRMNWFLVLLVISALLAIYSLLLLVFTLFQLALKEPLDLHCVHKFFLFVAVVFIAMGTALMTKCWAKEWATVHLSFQATAPFLQLGGVGALTLVSWLVFHGFHKARRAVSKVLIMLVFLGVSVVIFLSPLFIQSPCLMEEGDVLPPKPGLIGHRGAPMLAPENTLMSFQRSVNCNVIAFETDVQVSKDGVPFLMHDSGSKFLWRTTDVREKISEKELNDSKNFTWEELQRLNADKWLLETEPFLSISQHAEAKNHSVPSLAQLLDLAKSWNISVIFDMKNDLENDTLDDTINTLDTILKSEIPRNQILWLPPNHRAYVKKAAPGFTHVYDNVSKMDGDGGDHLNINYNMLNTTMIRHLRGRNVSVNLWTVNEPWLFSLLWCSGASSVTTSACHLLQNMTHPVWTMSMKVYRIIWISVDVASFLIMSVLFILKWCRLRHTTGKEKPIEEVSFWSQTELYPFLDSK
ncbi:hypothetical protein UPYG_G00216280 [Umbra pygmaea]|uniref:GP-PDE domain-containing protein n=1 Tax=Umbra pygmaea TaxID=75934 RepID=A0ABD0WKU6_UMBPY